METFATDGGVQPQLQPHSGSDKSTDWKSNGRDPFPADGARELRSSSVSALRNEALLSPVVSTGRNGFGGGHSAGRSPGALRLHPAFLDLKLAGWLICSELQVKSHGIREPILITRKGIIVYGFADWHAAVSAGQAEIDCIDFALDDDEALQLILSLHRPRAAWNDFIRAELALK